MRGIEPLTSALRTLRSPSWATSPARKCIRYVKGGVKCFFWKLYARISNRAYEKFFIYLSPNLPFLPLYPSNPIKKPPDALFLLAFSGERKGGCGDRLGSGGGVARDLADRVLFWAKKRRLRPLITAILCHFKHKSLYYKQIKFQKWASVVCITCSIVAWCPGFPFVLPLPFSLAAFILGWGLEHSPFPFPCSWHPFLLLLLSAASYFWKI